MEPSVAIEKKASSECTASAGEGYPALYQLPVDGKTSERQVSIKPGFEY